MDKIELELTAVTGQAQNIYQKQQHQVEFKLDVETMLFFAADGIENVLIGAAQYKAERDRSRNTKYLKLAQNLENNTFDAAQMRAVLGRHVDVNEVVDTFQHKSVCNEAGEIISKSKMKRMVR
jgi:hypothetical protein